MRFVRDGGYERKYNARCVAIAVNYSLAVIARLDRAIQYAAAVMMRRNPQPGVLDSLPEPVIGRPFGRPGGGE
jgi:hypothetical protein